MNYDSDKEGTEKTKLLENIQLDAFQRMSWVNAKTANLHIETELLRKGHIINARHQEIPLKHDTVIVFSDDAPLYNWAHPCRYLLYDANSGKLYEEVKAEFPTHLNEPPETYKAFHMPVSFVRSPKPIFRIRTDYASLMGSPLRFWNRGKRYAVLFSGASNNRHTNDLEFLYRTLIDIYDFSSDNIYVLNHDGTINYNGWPKPVGNWPGDDTPYRMPVSAEGTKSELENVLDELKTRLGKDDFLLIHTNNHGGHDGTESYLCTYSPPDYTASDFAAKLSELPHFAQLMVMMEQCHSGGFNRPIIDNSPADETTIASACEEHRSSIGGAEFDPFARDWIAAVTGIDPYGAALAHDPDTSGDSIISATEAFTYADTIKDPYDTPVYNETPTGSGGSMHLGRPDPNFVLSKIQEFLKIYEIGPGKPLPPTQPGPFPGPGPYVYDEVIKHMGEIEKLIR
jgi:hypothetical protein